MGCVAVQWVNCTGQKGGCQKEGIFVQVVFIRLAIQFEAQKY